MNDSDLKQLFREQKQADENQTPAFEQVWGAAEARAAQRRRRQRLFRFAAAAVILLALGITLFSVFRRPAPSMADTITTWQSPTVALLHVPEEARTTVTISYWRSPTESLLLPAFMNVDSPDRQ